MRKASSFRWTPLRVGVLFPLAALLLFPRGVLIYLHMIKLRDEWPYWAGLASVFCAGAVYYILTRVSPDASGGTAVAIAAYGIGALTAGFSLYYIRLVQAELASRK